MPQPQEHETQQEFINRCIPQVINEGTATTPEQAFAICQTFWSRSKKSFNTKNIQNEGIKKKHSEE